MLKSSAATLHTPPRSRHPVVGVAISGDGNSRDDTNGTIWLQVRINNGSRWSFQAQVLKK